jgi:hypothetical protein
MRIRRLWLCYPASSIASLSTLWRKGDPDRRSVAIGGLIGAATPTRDARRRRRTIRPEPLTSGFLSPRADTLRTSL